MASIYGYLMAGGYSVRVLVKIIFFFFFFTLCHSNLDFLVIFFMFKYDFTDIFHFQFYSGVPKMSDRKAIRSQAREIAANVLKACEGEAKNGVLSIPLSQYRERASMLTGVSTRTLSRIKAEAEKEILTSRKPRSDTIELDNFDKCVVRRTVNEMYGLKKITPTLDRILIELRERLSRRKIRTHECASLGFHGLNVLQTERFLWSERTL